MPSKVLLINFTVGAAEVCQNKYPDLVFERGYVSESYSLIRESQGKEVVCQCYFPHTLHEYRLILISLDARTTINLKSEFGALAIQLGAKQHADFRRYYMHQGILIFLLGDCSARNLSIFALPQIELDDGDKDESISFYFDEEPHIAAVLKDGLNSISLPPTKYVREKREDDQGRLVNYNFWNGFTFRPAYRNKSNEVLGAVYCVGHYNSLFTRGCLFLPQFQDNSLLVVRLVRAIAQIDPHIIPEIYLPDWQTSNDYYHQKYYDVQKEVAALAQEYKKKLASIEAKIDEEKKAFENIRNLLVQKDDELKNTVFFALKDVCGLNVVDVDEEGKTNGKTTRDEDLLVTYKDRIFPVEVKGTEAENPAEKFISQIYKHMAKGGHKDGALIVNHDLKITPDSRSEPYAGSSASLLEEDDAIVFIDSRILYGICKDIFEGKLTKEVAQEILFGGHGRVVYPVQEKNAK